MFCLEQCRYVFYYFTWSYRWPFWTIERCENKSGAFHSNLQHITIFTLTPESVCVCVCVCVRVRVCVQGGWQGAHQQDVPPQPGHRVRPHAAQALRVGEREGAAHHLGLWHLVTWRDGAGTSFTQTRPRVACRCPRTPHMFFLGVFYSHAAQWPGSGRSTLPAVFRLQAVPSSGRSGRFPVHKCLSLTE